MSVLQGVSRDGDFVLNNQALADKQGFRNVSKIWYNQTMSYEDGCKKMDEMAKNRDDRKTSISDVQFITDLQGKFAIAFPDGFECKPTEHAMSQLSLRMEIPTTYSKWALRPGRDEKDIRTFINVLKNEQRKFTDSLLWRTYNDGTLRAVLTERYAIVNNDWLLNVVQEAIPEGRLSHWRGDADTIYGNVLIPDSIREEFDSDYGGMLSIGNSEIGLRPIDSWPSIFRAICMNGCIWDRVSGHKVHQVHRGKRWLASLKDRIISNLHDQIPLVTIGIDKLLEATKIEIEKGKIPSVVAEIAVENKLYAGVANAITRAGQLYTNDEWLKLDTIGGDLLDTKVSGRVIRKAYALTADEVKLALGA
jgi:hypothetical protein